MPKFEVTWNTTTPDGEKRQVCARSQGDRWVFLARARRYDDWVVLPSPSLEDFLALLDGVRRRGSRRRATPRDEARLRAHIRKLFPDAVWDEAGTPRRG